jgi:hypothetical protein
MNITQEQLKPRFFTWIPLPALPQVPEHFIQRLLNLAVPHANPEEESLVKRGSFSLEYKNRLVKKDNVLQPTRAQERFEMGEDWADWVRTNIIPTFADTDGRLSVGVEGATLHGAHTDGPLYRLFYLVSDGGELVETAYYQSPTDPVLYACKSNKVEGYDDMDLLTEIDRTKFPVNGWVLHNGYVLHAVHNITGNRVNLNVTILPEHERFILSKGL